MLVVCLISISVKTHKTRLQRLQMFIKLQETKNSHMRRTFKVV